MLYEPFLNTDGVMVVTIPLDDFVKLNESDNKLLALEGAGVDNWSGYAEAMESLKDMDNESE